MVDFWDGIMPGNLALSSLYTLVFGWPGLRLLHVTLALTMGLQGYLLGKRYSSNVMGGYIGAVVFALNPFMLMVQDTDRNIMALAFGSLLFVLLVYEIGEAILLGIIVGFTAGLGLQMLPLLFLIPVGWHLWQRNRRPSQLIGTIACSLAISALWLLRIGWYDPGPLNPLHTYDLGFVELRLQYVLGFPFHPEITHGPFGSYPVLLTHLFYFANTLGMVLVGIGVLGWTRLAVTRRKEFWTLILFGLPALLLLGLMVRIIPDQLRLVIPCLLPLLMGAVVGLTWLLSRPPTWHRVALLGAALIVPFLIVSALAQVRVDEDPRFDKIPPPRGADPVAAYMTPEARENLGMGTGEKRPPEAADIVGGEKSTSEAAPVAIKRPSDTSTRLDTFTWPSLLPNYWDRHPLERDDQDRWGDLQF